MRPFPLPVRAASPVAEIDDDPPQVLDIPCEVLAFEMPRVPDHVSPNALVDAQARLAAFHAQMSQWDRSCGRANPRLDIHAVPADTRAVLNEVLGEGEVAIQVSGSQPWRIQETVFTGVWRVCAVNRDGAIVSDALEAAPLPDIVTKAARAAAVPDVPHLALLPGAMNSPALLHEIAAHVAHGASSAAHVLNLTLLPMTPEDHRTLERALPVGPVAMISRGFGNCRVTSTGVRDVWRVQYFNSMNTLILNTIEIVSAPEVVIAADEDLDDTVTRLAELLEWMADSA